LKNPFIVGDDHERSLRFGIQRPFLGLLTIISGRAGFDGAQVAGKDAYKRIVLKLAQSDRMANRQGESM
jgi:hypothetical protein